MVTLISHDLEVRSTLYAVVDTVSFLTLYVAVLRRGQRLSKLEGQSTPAEVLAELRTTVRIILPIASYLPVLVIVQRLVFGR